MKKLKLILTSSAILIAVAAAFALRETRQDNPSKPHPLTDSMASEPTHCK